MTPELSIYLDLVRFAAAFAVFLSHLSGRRLTGGLFWQAGPYGSRAVMLFFVLSGFVIGYVADRRERSAREFMASRAARIYSVALPALLATYLLDALGRAVSPALYSSVWGYQANGIANQIVSAVLFLNQIWYRNIAPGSDLPYWSLGYEVWYYIVFGLFAFCPGRARLPAALLALAIAGPGIAALFPVWLLGVLTYRLCKRLHAGSPARSIAGIALFVLPILAWPAWLVAAGRYHLQGAAGFTLNGTDPIEDGVIALLFATHLIGLRLIGSHLSGLLGAVRRPVRWCAGATFTLYLFHLPIVQCLAAILPGEPAAFWRRAVLLLGTLVLVFLIAEVSERRKEAWRRGFLALSARRSGTA